METIKEKALEYLKDNRDKLIDTLGDFLRVPSISTEAAHVGDIQRAAEWLAGHLQSLGMEEVELFPTDGAPVVYGASKVGNPGIPTLLIYGHYDVQPTDPLGEWQSDPFDPEIRGENLFARGASDMKGAIVAAITAILVAFLWWLGGEDYGLCRSEGYTWWACYRMVWG